MKRRFFLGSASSVSISLAGCLADYDNASDNTEYEMCDRKFVKLDSLPSPAKDEAEAAIENGSYETTDQLTLSEVIDLNRAYLYESDNHGFEYQRSHRYIYFDVRVENEGSVTRLRIEETVPPDNSPYVWNGIETDLMLDVRVNYDRDLLVEKTIDLAAGAKTPLLEDVEYRYGYYYAVFDTRDSETVKSEKISWRENHRQGIPSIYISSDGLTTGEVADEIEGCRWDNEGELEPNM